MLVRKYSLLIFRLDEATDNKITISFCFENKRYHNEIKLSIKKLIIE